VIAGALAIVAFTFSPMVKTNAHSTFRASADGLANRYVAVTCALSRVGATSKTRSSESTRKTFSLRATSGP
jgi:hypothetical protein